jgi:hypothetical protein
VQAQEYGPAPLHALTGHLVALDGQIVGHWKRTVSRQAVRLEVALHGPFDDVQAAALHAEADRHGAFLGLPATVHYR